MSFWTQLVPVMLEGRDPSEAIDRPTVETDTTNAWKMVSNFFGSSNTTIAAPNRNSISPNGISTSSNAVNAVTIANVTRPNGSTVSQNANGGTPKRVINRTTSNARRTVTSNNSRRNRNDSIKLVIYRRNDNSNSINIPLASSETRNVLVHH